MLRRWCRVNDHACLRAPHLEALEMKTHQSPVLTAEQSHWLIGRDGGAAAIAYLPEARTALPQLNRVPPREATASDPLSYEFFDGIRNHYKNVAYLQCRSNTTL